MIMMRSALLALLAVVVCEASKPKIHTSLKELPPANSVSIENRGQRTLQGTTTSTYTAVWYFVHEGSCTGATEPNIILSCDGGDGIAVDQQSEAVICESSDDTGLTVECTTEAVVSSGHAVDFSCTGASLEETTAKATIPEQVDGCLGGDQLAAEWGHGVLLSLLCDGQRALNGTCTPLNTTFPDNTCTSGWSCPIGNCTIQDYTIGEMTSTVSNNECADFPGDGGGGTGLLGQEPTSGASTFLSTAVVAGAVSIGMLVGGW